MARPEVLPQSIMSLYVETYFENQKLCSATAFTIEHNNKAFLITNRHVVSGRDHTNKLISDTGAIPNKIRIYFNQANKLGSWLQVDLYLYSDLGDNDTFIWHEHPMLKNKGDLVAIEINRDERIDLYPYSLDSNFDIKIQPSDYLSVIGFPFGVKSHGYIAIWSTGFLATDIDLNYDNMPVFLIDCRTRQGQSGSPVIAHRNSGIYMSNSGSTQLSAGIESKLLGIYSGRLNNQSDLGFVWKLDAIKELLSAIT